MLVDIQWLDSRKLRGQRPDAALRVAGSAHVVRLVKAKAFLILLALGVFFASGCAAKRGIIIAGSTSVQPFAEILAEEYMNLHPEAKIDIQGGGSSAGILATVSGIAHIGMSSRELVGEEKRLWATEIAKDALALVVHPSNPVGSLRLEEVQEIYAARIKNWSQVGGQRREIHVVTREEGSGTRAAFEKLVMDGQTVAGAAIVQDSNGAVRQVVADDPDAIGFISSGLVNDKVKAVGIDGVAATKDTVLSGQYKLVRVFVFVVSGEPAGETRRFLDFSLSAEGQKLLSAEGLVTANGSLRK